MKFMEFQILVQIGKNETNWEGSINLENPLRIDSKGLS